MQIMLVFDLQPLHQVEIAMMLTSYIIQPRICHPLPPKWVKSFKSALG
jgi:hypothetical protein